MRTNYDEGCESCGETRIADDSYRITDDGIMLCDDCYAEHTKHDLATAPTIDRVVGAIFRKAAHLQELADSWRQRAEKCTEPQAWAREWGYAERYAEEAHDHRDAADALLDLAYSDDRITRWRAQAAFGLPLN